MPKLSPLFACLPLLWLHTGAQQELRLSKFTSFSISIPFAEEQRAAVLSEVSVMDQRFDTSKLGFAADGTKGKMLLLNGGVASGFQAYLQKRYVSSNAALPKLLLVVRKLWMQEMRAGELRHTEEENEKQNISSCAARLEVFVKQGEQVQALLRMDTVLEDKTYLKSSGGWMLADLLEATVQRVTSLNIPERTTNKTKLLLPDLTAKYHQRFALPRLQADSLRRGIYYGFQDFLQNKPAEADFGLEQTEGGDYLYINNKGGQPQLLTDFWGFCDGKHHFVKLGTNFFALVRDGNAYSFKGCLQAIHNAKPRSQNRIARYMLFGALGEAHSNRLVNFLRPMQIDMETGKPY